MIKANKLRIGNLVSNDHSTCEILHLNGGDFINCTLKTKQGNPINAHYDLIEPIPLTEEWLLKAGFKCDDYKSGYIGIDVHNENGMSTDFVLSYPGRMGEWQKYFAWEFNNYMFNKIEYVHELQNFYSAMTGYELIF